MSVAMAEPPVDTEIEASADRLREALESGGRAVLTVRSRRTGSHVTISLVAKKKIAEGWVSRATIDGRVGIREADSVFADDPTLEWPDSRVGSFDLRSGEWRPRKDGDRARIWAAEKAFLWALGRFPLDDFAEVYMATTCSYCGLPLTDPVSIERGIGPDCWGRHTGSKSAERS